jgi:hypothetical protein
MRPPYMATAIIRTLLWRIFSSKSGREKSKIFVKTSFYSRRMDFLFAWAREKLSPSHEMECVR